MNIAKHSERILPARCTLLAASLGLLLGACAASTAPRGMDLGQPAPRFNIGRMTVVLVDEYGIELPGMRVDLSWQEPSFFKTSAFTNRQGQVTFSGVPEIAELSVDHPGGNFTGVVAVPQSGRPEYRIILDTRGGGEQMREQERLRLMSPAARSALPQ